MICSNVQQFSRKRLYLIEQISSNVSTNEWLLRTSHFVTQRMYMSVKMSVHQGIYITTRQPITKHHGLCIGMRSICRSFRVDFSVEESFFKQIMGFNINLTEGPQGRENCRKLTIRFHRISPEF
jgi:hypothetical protein